MLGCVFLSERKQNKGTRTLKMPGEGRLRNGSLCGMEMGWEEGLPRMHEGAGRGTVRASGTGRSGSSTAVAQLWQGKEARAHRDRCQKARAGQLMS